jgi:hypothetical protein
MGGRGRSRRSISTIVSALYCRGYLFPAGDAYQATASSAPKQFKRHVLAQLVGLQTLATRDAQRVDSPRSRDWLVGLRSFIVNPNLVSRNCTRQPTIAAIILKPVRISSSTVNGKNEHSERSTFERRVRQVDGPSLPRRLVLIPDNLRVIKHFIPPLRLS